MKAPVNARAQRADTPCNGLREVTGPSREGLMGTYALPPGREDRAHRASGLVGGVAVILAVVALATFGLVGTIGLSGAWLYLAAGAGLLALALLIMEPEQLRIAQPLRRLESHAVSTTVNPEPRCDGRREMLAQAESGRASPDRRAHLAPLT